MGSLLTAGGGSGAVAIPPLAAHQKLTPEAFAPYSESASLDGAAYRSAVEVAKEQVRITATSPDNGEGEDVVAVESATGKPEVRIGVQGKFLADVCDATGDCDIELGLSGELDPIKVYDTEAGGLYVIMPMRV